MSKKSIVNEIAKKNGLTQAQTLQVVNDFLEMVVENVAAGERIQFTGFGTFEAVKQKARMVYNPTEREMKEVPEKFVPKFRPSKTFKDAVAKQ